MMGETSSQLSHTNANAVAKKHRGTYSALCREGIRGYLHDNAAVAPLS